MLKVIDLDKSFRDHQVLKHLNLEVKDGSIFGLVGVNGAGKSTLLRCIAGVYQPDHGEILLDEQNTYTNAKIRNQISFVSDEQYYPLGSTINSLKLLYESLYEFDENTFQKYLKIFELDPKMTIANLSKGMKRRVSILFALSTHPKLLLLDEAYDGLEPLARLHFKQALANMIEEEKVSVIISSHNLKELEDICDSFGILEDGQIVSYGDLLESKEQINKYQIVFQDDFDEEKLHDENLLHLEKEGRVYKLVIRGEQEEVLKKLNSYQPILVDMLPVNFEELFIYELESRGHKYE